ncbi:MAG: methionine adenosyltransferase [Chloroflexi bacterium]|nr:methionine adenosyltransferase [Chloroflexota bacterium]
MSLSFFQQDKVLFTSESVTEGHPDKLCDQVSDAILDDILQHDPEARVACETLATTGMVLVAGEVTTRHQVDVQEVVRRVVADIGYTDASMGFDAATCAVLSALHGQSPDIAVGVTTAQESREGGEQGELGAGDQGMMFGFACDETPEAMPLPITLAHRLAKELASARKVGALPYLRPDGKSQVTVEYQQGRPVRVDKVVIATQHERGVPHQKIRTDVIERVVRTAVPAQWLDHKTTYVINGTGVFETGGPHGDCGLTGRKIIVDTYGGYARHGGGAFSGKDPTKVDRSAAYACRYVAKNVVKAGLARRCEIQIAYVIGVARPLSLNIETFGTGTVPDAEIKDRIERAMDFRPRHLIERFGLRRPIYRQTAAYGHFGRPELPWEATDLTLR